MQTNDIKKFTELMSMMCEVYNTPASPMKIDTYFKLLSDLNINEVENAITHMLRDRTFQGFPKPAEIREAVYGNPEERAISGVQQIVQAMETIGSWSTISFEDPILNRIVKSFGWTKLCETTYEQLPFVIARFQKEYKAYLQTDNNNYKNILLAGNHDIGNAANGYKELQPVNLIPFDGSIKKIPQLEFIEKFKEIGKDKDQNVIDGLVKKLGSI